MILEGKKCQVGIESTVLDCSGDIPVILRPGKITKSQIEKVLGKTIEVLADTTQKVNSPGVRYKHYSPNCPSVLNFDQNVNKVIDHFNEQKTNGKNPVILCLDSQKSLFNGCQVCSLGATEEDFATNLYGALRQNETKYDYIIIVWYSTSEFAQSVFNRLERVVGHNFI